MNSCTTSDLVGTLVRSLASSAGAYTWEKASYACKGSQDRSSELGSSFEVQVPQVELVTALYLVYGLGLEEWNPVP